SVLLRALSLFLLQPLEDAFKLADGNDNPSQKDDHADSFDAQRDPIRHDRSLVTKRIDNAPPTLKTSTSLPLPLIDRSSPPMSYSPCANWLVQPVHVEHPRHSTEQFAMSTIEDYGVMREARMAEGVV